MRKHKSAGSAGAFVFSGLDPERENRCHQEKADEIIADTDPPPFPSLVLPEYGTEEYRH